MTVLQPVPVIGKRPKLTKAQRIRVFDQGGGVCHLCDLPIHAGEQWHAEHPEFRAGGGSDKIEDLRPAHVDCHKPKTKADRKTLAKHQAIRAKHLGIKPIGPDCQIPPRPMPTTRKAAARKAKQADRIGVPNVRQLYAETGRMG